MFSVRRFLLISLALCSAMFVVPFAATAELLCVNVDPCGSGLIAGTPENTIQDALDAAANNGIHDDVVWIGSSPLPYTGPFVYNDGERVTVLGVGPTKPTLLGAGSDLAVFQLVGNPASKIQNLKLSVPAKPSGMALYWEGVAEDLDITYSGANFEVRGVLPTGVATLRDSTIDINNTGALGYGLGIDAAFASGSGLSLENVDISGNARGGVTVPIGVHVTITRSTIVTDRSAVQLAGIDSEVVASQSVLRSSRPAAADGVVSVLSGGEFDGDHVTIHGDGTARGLAVDSTEAGVENNARASLINSIISNVAVAGLSTEQGAIIQTNYTLLPGALQTVGGGATAGLGSITGVPNYANAAAGDFRLTAPQASIDAGDPVDNTAEDRAGNPRKVDGDSDGTAISDLGAYEYQDLTPVVSLSAPTKLEKGATGSFSATATDDPGDSISFAWNFGDGTATGANVAHAFAGLGPKTVTVTATDQLGNSSAATATVSVVDESAPALAITGVKLNKKRTAIEASVACPATETSCQVGYKLASAKKLKVGKKKKIVTLAKPGSKNAVGGSTTKLQIKLNKTALGLLKKGSLKMKLFVTLTDGAQNSATRTVQYTAKQGKTGSAKK